MDTPFLETLLALAKKLRILLRDRLCLEFLIVSSNFQALLVLQDKLLESVR